MTKRNQLYWSWFPRPIPAKDKRSVFITGAPRCGSSWVGEVLGSLKDTRYIYEPFNHQWMPSLRGKLAHFTYFKHTDSAIISKTTDYAFQGRQSWTQLNRAIYRRYIRAATRKASIAIVKDPTASLISAWLARKTKARIVFVMRHPCGFASSLDKLDWQVKLQSLIRQKPLMRDYLERFKDLLIQSKNDKWHSRGVFWASLHYVFMEQMKSNPDWLLYRYEDICHDPVGQFSIMANELNLTISSSQLHKIQTLSAVEGTDPGSTRRISAAMPDIWRERMTTGEIDAVMGVVSEFNLNRY